LVAYYTVAETEEGIGRMRSTRRRIARLPESKLAGVMCRRRMCGLEKLPLTANLKLDRKALPAPGGTRTGCVRYEAAEGGRTRNGGGGNLGGFAEGRGGVGRRDNSSPWGGHSLLAMQVIARLRKTLGVEVDQRCLRKPGAERFCAESREREAIQPAADYAVERAGGCAAFVRATSGWFMAQMEGREQSLSRSVGRAVAWQVG